MLEELKSFKVLPIIILYATSTRMSTLSTENLNLEKACLVNIGYNDSICEAMILRNKSGYTAEQEIDVQKLVTSMVAYKAVILGIFPFILMLFVGSWSDRHRIRKPFMFLPIYGDIVMNIGCIFCAFFFRELPMEVAIFFEAVPPALTGTWLCCFVGVFSYISEHSSREKRTYVLGIATMCVHCSFNVGVAISGILHKLLGFYGVYCASTIMCTTAIIYGNIFIEDTTQYKRECSRKEFLKDVFDYKHILGTISVLFINQKRKKVLSLILILLIIFFKLGTRRGEAIVTYMFTRRRFTWDEVDFSAYNTFHFFITLSGLFICVTIFVKWLKLDDAVIGMITMPNAVIACVAYSFVPTGFYFYLGTLPEILAGSVHLVKRSIMSKLVTNNELGQVFAVAALVEATANPIFGPIYSFVYYQTVDKLPGAFFILSAILHAADFLGFFCLYLLKTKEPAPSAVNRQTEEDVNLSAQPEVTNMLQSDCVINSMGSTEIHKGC